MRFWIKKDEMESIDNEWIDSYIFSIYRNKSSTIYTNISKIWYWMDSLTLSPIYEDVFIIGLSIFAIDKRLSRSYFLDNWTREISVSIPVIEYDKWISTINDWNKMLSFLTGDIWDIHFRRTSEFFSKHDNPNRRHLQVSECDCISLFSGGLDSFCGAIKLLEDGKSPCLVGHNEYPKLRKKQENFVDAFKTIYTTQKVEFLSFTANSRAPLNINGNKLTKSEDTSRGRSLLFLCAALSIASILSDTMTIYIPENGFIGLNLPLTSSRIGTCSTRTTHPYFLSLFQSILKKVGINNKIKNFYAFSTKREIVCEVMNKKAFITNFAETISCSHPCNPRYNTNGNNDYPINCGYCYPCLIRKSSLLDIKKELSGIYSYDISNETICCNLSSTDKIRDYKAVQNSIYKYKNIDDVELEKMIRNVGKLDENSVKQFVRVYKSTMEDLQELFSSKGREKNG